MVILPEEFEATRFSGYYWNTSNKKLYSCKVTGELKPLKLQSFAYKGKCFPGSYYQISVKGRRRIIPLIELHKIEKTSKITTFPVYIQGELF